jgi:E-phenylitaconyl-CoA hydratase
MRSVETTSIESNAMSEPTVILQRDGHVAEITINRPGALNALDVDALVQLRGHLITCRDDRSVRAIIVTGAGERAFCVGSDLKRSAPDERTYAEAMVLGDEQSVATGNYVRYLMLHHLQLWKPLIAAINGHCIGGGLELALQCDLRVASTQASFGLPEAKVGSFPGAGGVPMLLRKLPAAIAMKLMLTGDRLDAAQALHYGLVSDVWQPADLLPEARRLAHRVAANGPLAVAALKRLAQDTEGLSLAAAYDLAEHFFGILKNSQDRIEGRRAFAEKRTPNFVGR